MITGSCQPRHGIAKAKALGYAKHYRELAAAALERAIEKNSELEFKLACAFAQMATERQNAAERNP